MEWPAPVVAERVKTRPSSPSERRTGAKAASTSAGASRARKWPCRRTSSVKAISCADSPASKRRTSMIFDFRWLRLFELDPIFDSSSAGVSAGASSSAMNSTGRSGFTPDMSGMKPDLQSVSRSATDSTGTSRPSAGVSLSFGAASACAAAAKPASVLRTMTRGGCSGPTTHLPESCSVAVSRRVK